MDAEQPEPIEEQVPEADGVDSSRGNPNCPLCKGRGYVSVGPLIMNQRICFCVIEQQEQLGIDKWIETHFPKRSREMTFERFNTGGSKKNEVALRVARNYVKHWPEAREKGWMIGFYGEPSAGKTHLATALAIGLMRTHKIHAEVLNVSNMLRMERERFNNPRAGRSPIEVAIEAEFLVLDDLGAERQKSGDDYSWVAETLYQVLDARVMDCKPTVFTSNLDPHQLQSNLGSGSAQDIVGERLWGRIERALVTAPLQVMRVAGEARQSDSAARKLFADPA